MISHLQQIFMKSLLTFWYICICIFIILFFYRNMIIMILWFFKNILRITWILRVKTIVYYVICFFFCDISDKFITTVQSFFLFCYEIYQYSCFDQYYQVINCIFGLFSWNLLFQTNFFHPLLLNSRLGKWLIIAIYHIIF